MARIVLVEDDPTLRQVIRRVLHEAGHEVQLTESVATAQLHVERGAELVVSDVMLPLGAAWDDLVNLRRRFPETPLAIISGKATLMTAVDAERVGADLYFPKPFDIDAFCAGIEGLLSQPRTSSPVKHRTGIRAKMAAVMVGQSPAMQHVYQRMAQCYDLPSPVFIHGEAGVGKRLVAYTLHLLRQTTAAAGEPHPFLVGSSGVFSEVAPALSSKTTLYVPRIEQCTASDQQRLLDWAGQRDGPSIVISSSLDLRQLRDRRWLSETLATCLAKESIALPPLRDRMGDLPDLVSHQLRRIGARGSRSQGRDLPTPPRIAMPRFPTLEPSAFVTLQEYTWPGNVAELFRCISAAVEAHQRSGSVDAISADIVGSALREVATATAEGSGHPEVRVSEPIARAVEPSGTKADESQGGAASHAAVKLSDVIHQEVTARIEARTPDLYRSIMNDLETILLSTALERVGGNQSHAARLLGLHRNTMGNRLRALGKDVV